MKFARSQSGREPARVELTPLIDVVFLLLIFFMITTTFVDQSGLQVDLPESGASPLSKDDATLVVELDTAGRVAVGGQAVPNNQLTARLQAAAAENSDVLLVIRADEGVAHGEVVRVMDLAHAAGLTRQAIGTEGKVPGAAP